MRSGGDCGAAQWASEDGQSESTQDAMPPHLTLCTRYAAQGHTTGFNGRRIPGETGLKKTGISLPVAVGSLVHHGRPEAMESLL